MKLKQAAAIAAGLVICFLLGGCTRQNVSSPVSSAVPQTSWAASEAVSSRDFLYDDWYTGYFTAAGITDPIQISRAKSGAVAEYRVMRDTSFFGNDCYILQVFADGTATFIYKLVNNRNEESEDPVSADVTVKLTKEETDELLAVIKENHFWEIPTEHPDEEKGLDGRTFFVEGCTKDQYHFIHMWEPPETYGISKILYAFSDVGDTLQKKPPYFYGKQDE